MNKKIIVIILIGMAIFLSGCIDVKNNSEDQNSSSTVGQNENIPIKEIKSVQYLHIYGYQNPDYYYTVTVFTDGLNKCYVLERGDYSISCI